MSVNKDEDLTKYFYDILLKLNDKNGEFLPRKNTKKIFLKMTRIPKKSMIYKVILLVFIFCFDIDTKNMINNLKDFNYAVLREKHLKQKRKWRSHHRVKQSSIVEDKSGEFRLSHHLDLKIVLQRKKDIRYIIENEKNYYCCRCNGGENAPFKTIGGINEFIKETSRLMISSLKFMVMLKRLKASWINII